MSKLTKPAMIGTYWKPVVRGFRIIGTSGEYYYVRYDDGSEDKVTPFFLETECIQENRTCITCGHPVHTCEPV